MVPQVRHAHHGHDREFQDGVVLVTVEGGVDVQTTTRDVAALAQVHDLDATAKRIGASRVILVRLDERVRSAAQAELSRLDGVVAAERSGYATPMRPGGSAASSSSEQPS